MKVRDTIKSIINSSVAKVAREAGFKKSRLNFYRRKGTVVQLINIQLSRSNLGENGRFYVNIALAFDELRMHEATPITETPKEWECDFRRRLEHLVPDTPFSWEVSPQVDAEALAQALLQRIGIVLGFLDNIDSLPSFLEIALTENWFALPGEYSLLARLHDVVGNIEAAQECRRLYKEFLHNRETMSPNEFLEYYGFKPVL